LQRGFIGDRQKALSVYYENLKMEIGFRADLIVGYNVVIEFKSVETVWPVVKKILLTYFKTVQFTNWFID